jgi:hypothetical protein
VPQTLGEILGSFFRRVTRFPLGSAVDPRENRLTEITAAVFDEVPGFARDVTALLLAEGSLGGTSYAALRLPKNSVGSKQIRKRAVGSSRSGPTP